MRRRRIVAVAAGLGGAALIAVMPAAEATVTFDAPKAHLVQAPSGTVMATLGVNLRKHIGTGPVSFEGDEPVGDGLPYGTKVWLSCYYFGPWVQGPTGTTNIWDAIEGYQMPGQQVVLPLDRVVVTDPWIDTGSNLPVVPHC